MAFTKDVSCSSVIIVSKEAVLRSSLCYFLHRNRGCNSWGTTRAANMQNARYDAYGSGGGGCGRERGGGQFHLSQNKAFFCGMQLFCLFPTIRYFCFLATHEPCTRLTGTAPHPRRHPPPKKKGGFGCLSFLCFAVSPTSLRAGNGRGNGGGEGGLTLRVGRKI